MKKIVPIILLAVMMSSVSAQKVVNTLPKGVNPDNVTVKLPAPSQKGGMPLYEALAKRQTNRDFSDKNLKMQQVSDLLWCANGVNRENGKRTAPSARNAQEIVIYVFNKEGVFRYNPSENLLEMVMAGDKRGELTSRGTLTVDAPLTLLYVADYAKMSSFDDAGREFYGATDAGFVSQNVYLYCAANGLNTVVMGAIDRDHIAELLQLKGKAVLAQPIGYPKNDETKK